MRRVSMQSHALEVLDEDGIEGRVGCSLGWFKYLGSLGDAIGRGQERSGVGGRYVVE
jgi:hypothetical protein